MGLWGLSPPQDKQHVLREKVETPSFLETFKVSLEGARNNLLQLRVFLLSAGHWTG